MTKNRWVKVITAKCQEAGTYRPYFDVVIEELSKILEIRDKAAKQFKKDGSEPVQTYTDSQGRTNTRKNPALAVINECNQQALAYWRDLGLTPAGYKKLTKGELDGNKTSGFEGMLARLDL